jgi:hypothetical protein
VLPRWVDVMGKGAVGMLVPALDRRAALEAEIRQPTSL